ncbi:ferredoxin reductase-like C-terminal NADP-linked domain-containing protein [Thelephora terrestris]|uniref:Ferredoxin reductase-like C-terminal NADP-linked domain-containing protein n=1 Tax=Thelephora terrestris TaxID=56493 RepID=A0A9P6HAY9_9AGAM|nr:ferredoxin reductase-like C-terminal NADP-linked domain-containing protein [Thelephora terrestris]
MAGDGQGVTSIILRTGLMLPRRFLSTTTTGSSKITAATRNAALRTMRSKYLLAGLVVWTGIGTYYLFPPSKNPYYSILTGISSGDGTPATLVPSKWSPVSVMASEETSKDTRLLTLSIPRHLIPSSSSTQPIWSIYIKDDDIQVERPYTPLEGIDKDGKIKLWVKKYPKGEVGRWLHSKKPGECIEIRGPLQTWLHEDHYSEWDEIIMISGGTGITPFYQLLHEELIKPKLPGGRNPALSNTRFTLLHASRSAEDLPPSALLGPLISIAQNDPSRLRVKLFVDEKDSSTDAPYYLNVGRIDSKAVEDVLEIKQPTIWDRLSWRNFDPKGIAGEGRKVLFLVCGPDPMISAVAGPRGRNYSQGPVGGILGQLGFGSEQVRKL